MDENKRRFRRVDFSIDVKLLLSESGREVNVKTHDVSENGLRLIIPSPPPKLGSYLKGFLSLEGKKMQEGKVCWVMAIRPALQNIPLFDVGVEFVRIDSSDKEFLKRLIDKSESK